MMIKCLYRVCIQCSRMIVFSYIVYKIACYFFQKIFNCIQQHGPTFHADLSTSNNMMVVVDDDDDDMFMCVCVCIYTFVCIHLSSKQHVDIITTVSMISEALTV